MKILHGYSIGAASSADSMEKDKTLDFSRLEDE